MNKHPHSARCFVLSLALLLTAAPSYPRAQRASRKLKQPPATTTTQAADNSETKLPKAHSFAPYEERQSSELKFVTEGRGGPAMDEADAAYRQGMLSLVEEHFDEAVPAFQQAVALKPDLAKAHFALAITLDNLKRYDEALAEYQRLLQLDDADKQSRAIALYNRGNIYLDQGKFKEALDEYQTLDKLIPRLATVHYNMGLAYIGLRQKGQAVEEFKAAIRPYPDNVSAKAHFNLGVVHLQLGRKDLAEEELKELQSLREVDLTISKANLAKRLAEMIGH